MSGPARRFSERGCACTLRCRRALPGVQHTMQVRDRVFDVIVLVLAGAVFCREHGTAMDLAEIPIAKFECPLVCSGFSSLIPAKPWRRTNSFSCSPVDRCSLHVSRSSNTIRPSLISWHDRMPSGLASRSWISPLEVATDRNRRPVQSGNRQNKAQLAMTAINSRMAFIDDRIR